MFWTLSVIKDDNVQTGYRYVQRVGGQPSRGGQPVYYQARLRAPGGVDEGAGPGRPTPEAAGQDYCDWRNGSPASTVVHSGRSGRPDWIKLDGVFHMDLPGEASSRPSSAPKKRRTSPERDFMLRMELHMRQIMRDGDMAEAKANSGRQACATAIGQLLIRHSELGGGRMFIVLPSEPDATVLTCLKQHRIKLVTEQGGTA